MWIDFQQVLVPFKNIFSTSQTRADVIFPPNRRSFAKYTLVMFMGQDEDLDRILRKNVTPNTMRNLEKILDALR